jgi:hypothetical protein
VLNWAALASDGHVEAVVDEKLACSREIPKPLPILPHLHALENTVYPNFPLERLKRPHADFIN